jgi:prepilin-type N-terminal cleavage/methylation domain-containing protein
VRSLATNTERLADHERGTFPRGLTLIELLVVLTILAILAAAAIVSTESVVSQGRFEATQSTLRAVEEAVLGPALLQAEDGAAATAGFVADVGRLPLELAELWANPHGLPPFRFQPADASEVGAAHADLDVVVPTGWRGPYLRLPIGGDQLLDGWGRPLEVLTTAGGEVAVVRSIGADGLPGDSPGDVYSRDVQVVFVSDDLPLDRCRATIRVTVWQRGEEGGLEAPGGTGSEHLVVRLFSPADGGIEVAANDPIPLAVPLTTAPAIEFFDVPIGPHVLRAYVQQDGSFGSARVRSSLPLEVHVHPLGSLNWRLVLPAPISAGGSEG